MTGDCHVRFCERLGSEILPCLLGLCREVKERCSLTCCNKDDTPMEALTIAKYRQHYTGGVAKPLYAAKAAKLLW